MDIQSLATNTAFTTIAVQRAGVEQAAPEKATNDASLSAQALSQDNKSLATANEVSRDQLELAVKATQDFVSPVNSSLEFSIDEDTQTSVVKIIDKETREIIRQIPSEEMLSIAKALDTIKGLLFHQKA